MHMPKRNLFAYICATLLGVCVILLAFRGQFDDLLGNIILGIIGATPVVRDAARKVGETKIGPALELAMMAALLLACTAYLVDGSFSPFLYFRF